MPVVEGEETSRLQMVAGVADVTNLVISWGSKGVEFINADITLAITRYPVTMEVGLSALDRTVCDGIAIGTAIVFDRLGQLGTATVVTLASPGIRDSRGGRPGLPKAEPAPGPGRVHRAATGDQSAQWSRTAGPGATVGIRRDL